jgi:multidrug efflux system outer membrane protein
MKRPALFVVMALLAASCTLGPDYTRPESALPSAYDNGAADAPTSELVDLPWWQGFGDPVLVDLVTMALAGNHDLRVATSRIAEARALARVSRADRQPQVGVGVSGEREQDSADTNANPGLSNTFDATVDVSWEADLFGRLRRADEAALARLVASEESRRGILLALVGDVARTYFELRDLDHQLAIATSTVSTRRQSLHIAELRFEGGLTSQVEVRQAETQLAQAEVLVPRLRQQRLAKESELAVLVGNVDFSLPTDAAAGSSAGEPPIVPAGLPSELLERRPDIRRAERDLEAANAEVGVAIASLYPRLSLTASAGSESDELEDLLGSGTGMWVLAANLTAPIWSGGRLRATLEATRERFEQAVLAYDRAVLEAFREVHDALGAQRHVAEELAGQERLERAAGEYLRLANLQYANGVVNYLDVLDAQRQFLDAQLTLSTARRDRRVAAVTLYRVLGGGWAAAEAELVEE